MSNHRSYKRRGVDYEVPQLMQTLPRQYYQSEEIYREELGFSSRELVVLREGNVI